MPLAFTQEDFLVLLRVSRSYILKPPKCFPNGWCRETGLPGANNTEIICINSLLKV